MDYVLKTVLDKDGNDVEIRVPIGNTLEELEERKAKIVIEISDLSNIKKGIDSNMSALGDELAKINSFISSLQA